MTDRGPAGVRRHLRVRGVVQGVGFRPFAHRLATGLGLAGHVGNDADGVFVEVEGPPAAVEEFGRRIRDDAPPLARIESVSAEPRAATGERGFGIVTSRTGAAGETLISPDVAPCETCLAEMADPVDRRHRYPLLNCTDCGPRFTITTGLPYDRPATTMAAFPMCAACAAEYHDPSDRRFHAQPTACPDCGPRLWLESPAGVDTATGDSPADPVAGARAIIEGGGIVAVKGVGGYHLACRADDDEAVRILRERKSRPDKPLAVMVADVAAARRIAQVDDGEAGLLAGPERPIVLLRARPDAALSPLVAPGNAHVGVLLPPSPLHSLLIPPGAMWVMTSGNRTSEPIVTRDADARARLGDIADAILGHDRPIHVPCDDSVIRVVTDGEGRPQPLPVRRSRGYAPYPVPLRLGGPTGRAPPVLAVGGELKATFCLTRGRHAFMSQHIGDMSNLETLQALDAAVAHMTAIFDVDPEVVACDAHPGYLSGRWARQWAGDRPVVAVQHHHAHLAALLAEHGRAGPIIGFSFDGTGWGPDQTVWGGEVLLADLDAFERVGHLRVAPLAGGDAAVRRPRRQALARLADAGEPWTEDLPPVAATPPAERRILARQLERHLDVVPTSSMGRLFDAVAALCGVRQEISYEGQAAIELEGHVNASLRDDVNAARWDAPGGYELTIDDAGVWDADGLVRAVAADVRAGQPPAVVATRFHRAVANAIVAAARRARADHDLTTVGLSGGVFQNVVLVQAAARALTADGFEVLTHRLVPPNDGGLALGQAAVAARALSRSLSRSGSPTGAPLLAGADTD